MDQSIEIELLNESTEKLNEYVRSLVRSKKVDQADSFCEEKYVQIAAMGFYKRIFDYFIKHAENDEATVKADIADIYESVNARLPGRAEISPTSEYISINAEEGVALNLSASDPENLSVTVCVPPPPRWSLSNREPDEDALDNDPQMSEPDGKEEKAPLRFPTSRLGAFCKATEHISGTHRVRI